MISVIETLEKLASKLDSAQRKQLPDSMFGYIDPKKGVRKFPMPDEEHVIKAWQFLGRSKIPDKEAVKQRILSRARALSMDTSNWQGK